jgi:hypothetical protein
VSTTTLASSAPRTFGVVTVAVSEVPSSSKIFSRPAAYSW